MDQVLAVLSTISNEKDRVLIMKAIDDCTIDIRPVFGVPDFRNKLMVQAHKLLVGKRERQLFEILIPGHKYSV